MSPKRPVVIWAEDDLADRVLMKRAMGQAGTGFDPVFVADGEELIDHLKRAAGSNGEQPLPALILLDLNMPRLDGRKALEILKSDERFRHIPIVVISTSSEPREVNRTYGLGANSFIAKPGDFAELVETMHILDGYWHKACELPAA